MKWCYIPLIMDKKRTGTNQNAEYTKKQKSENASSQGALSQRYGIGAQLLSKMGYVSGQGLGSDGSGIAEPISATNAASPKSSRAGLGMMSIANAVNEEYYTSSSEDEGESATPQIVSFKKSAISDVNDKDGMMRSSMYRKLSELENSSILGYRDDDMDTILELRQRLKVIDVSSLKQTRDVLNNLVDELVEATNRITVLDTQLPLLDNDMYDILTLEAVLNSLKSITSDTFDETINMILKLSDSDLVDKLISQSIRRVYANAEWDILDDQSQLLLSLKKLVDHIKYRLESKKGYLNQTQTTIFVIVFQKVDTYMKGLDFMKNDKDYENVISVLLNIEEIMQYIECHEYLLDMYVIPDIMKAVQGWDICDSTEQKTVRHWFQDFSMVFSGENIRHIKEILKKKVIEYCQTWDYTISKIPDERNLNFIRELFGSPQGTQIDYGALTSKYFTKHFLQGFWDQHYDPLTELGEWDGQNKSEKETSSILAFSVLHSYKSLLNEDDFKLIIQSAFNDLNKILFQWLIYANESDKVKAQYWFNWFINTVFTSIKISDSEIKQINRTIKFLNDWKFNKQVGSIHIEEFDIYGKLENLHNMKTIKDQKLNMSGYTMNNIPMRKVTTSFREVVQQYCEEHGLLMNKLSNKYAHLKYGKDSSVLVPIFELTRAGSRSLHIALKDDILWVEDEDSRYLPTFLWTLETLVEPLP